MLRITPAAISLIALVLRAAPAVPSPVRPDSPGVLSHLRGATIRSVAADPSGNLYVTGTTTVRNFPVKNAAQPELAEARLLRTNDLGATWTRLTLPDDVTAVVPDPVDPQVIFGLSDSVLYKSSDGGRTWRVVLRARAVAVVVDPANRQRVAAVTLADRETLVRSFDGGETWASSPAQISSSSPLAADPSGSGALIVADSISFDWGTTVQRLQPPSGSISAVAFDPLRRGRIYAGTARGSLGALYVSTDFGATWTQKTTPSFFYIHTLVADSDAPDLLYSGGPGGLWRSTDGGGTWSQLDSTGDIFVRVSRRCAPAGGLFGLVGGSGSFAAAFSTDGGAAWGARQFTEVQGIAGAGCAFYVTRRTTTNDGFVAKLGPDGSVLWSTYLGGADADTPIRVVLDVAGSAYVIGNTNSPDFPATAPRIGPAGSNGGFVTKYTPEGRIDYSLTIGGGAAATVTSLAVDGARNVYLAGNTLANDFPLTPGAALTRKDSGSYTGFVAKLSPVGTLLASTYLGPSYAFPIAFGLDPDGRPIAAVRVPADVGPQRVVLMRLNPSLTQITDTKPLDYENPMTGALAFDPQGNLILAMNGSGPATPGAFESPRVPAPCWGSSLFVASEVLGVSKLRPPEWTPVYRAVVQAPCGLQVSEVAVGSTGEPLVSVAAGQGMPLSRPVVGAPVCAAYSGAVLRLTPDGSRLDFATYVDSCVAPGLIPQTDGSLLIGGGDALVRVPPTAPGPQLDRIANSFSGDASTVVEGALVALAISGFTPPAIDLGLDRTLIPTTLGGVEVQFDGVPAGILQTGPGRVIVVVPSRRFNRTASGRETSIQVFYNGAPSNAVLMPVLPSRPGLLTVDFLDPRWHPDTDGYVLNADGAVNRADNPAARGSVVTLFITGMGRSNPPVYTNWKSAAPGVTPPPDPVTPLPGFLPAVAQLKVTVPASPPGTDLGNGVRRSGIVLRSGPASSNPPPISNAVGVYVK